MCGDGVTYMIGDMNGDGEVTLLDTIRIQKLLNAEQPATYGLRGDTADINQNGIVDVEDYWLFLELVIGYTPAMTLSAEPNDALADVDGSGAVDTDDYAIALAEYNEPSDRLQRLAADVNGDGEITFDDFDQTLHHVLNNCVCTVGSMANNPLPCSEKTYTYNARGQQIEYTALAQTASYAYNPSGLRSAKTVGGSTKYFVYNGSQIVFEYDDSGETLYYYGLNRTHNSNGEVYVYNAHVCAMCLRVNCFGE